MALCNDAEDIAAFIGRAIKTCNFQTIWVVSGLTIYDDVVIGYEPGPQRAMFISNSKQLYEQDVNVRFHNGNSEKH
jgi:hypothetical protein